MSPSDMETHTKEEPPKKEEAKQEEEEEMELDPAKKRERLGQERRDRQCVNPDCPNANPGGGTEAGLLSAAGTFQKAFFGAVKEEAGEGAKRLRRICDDCAERSNASLRRVSSRIKEGRPALKDLEAFMAATDMVTLDDSDEEKDDDSRKGEESSEESEFEVDVTSAAGEEDSSNEKFKALLSGMLKEEFNMEQQLNVAVKDIGDRLDAKKDDIEELDKMFVDLENEVDSLRKELYKGFRPMLSEVPPVDMDELEKNYRDQQARLQLQREEQLLVRQRPIAPKLVQGAPPVPPLGELIRTPLSPGDKAYAMRGNILNIWKSGNVVDVFKGGATSTYKLKFDVTDGKGKLIRTQSKVLMPRHLAYSEHASVRLPVGTRVIAIYKDPSEESPSSREDFYSGIVAEPPKTMNKSRYLVFFDDGYASYIPHHEIRVVIHQSKDVWDDIHVNSKEFVKKYLMQYPERPMVKLSVGQVVRTEWEGKWWVTRVQEVDASLVRLRFEADGRVENIYRGSTRLGPLYMELQQQKMRKGAQAHGAANAVLRRHNFRRDRPFVEYQHDVAEPEDPGMPGVGAKNQETKRAVARKSTTTFSGRRSGDILIGPGESLPHKPEEERWDLKGEVAKAAMRRVQGYPFSTHQCGPRCLEDPKYQYTEKILKNNSPLLVPILLGWERQLTKHKNQGRRSVFYLTPCGRRLRNLDEVHRYLRLTGSTLEIDFFNFEWYIHILNEFKPARVHSDIQDISYGKENVPISCINSLDKDYPVYVEYSTKRIPKAGVHINTESSFLTCCNCEDDCQDKDKCACWQLTIQSTAASGDGKVDPSVGYRHRRLVEAVQTGIFECNSLCSCKKTCLNRVAQHPLRQRLQVFKTRKRGWGIRTLVDIPAGAFICVYVGNLYTNSEANQVGQDFGDEYFAELDMIETVERGKDGYESDVDDDMDVRSRDSSVSPFRDEDEEEGEGEGEKDDEDDEECVPSTEDDDDDFGEDERSSKEDTTLKMPNVRPSHSGQDRLTRSSRRHRGDGVRGQETSSQKALKQPTPTKAPPRRKKAPKEPKEKFTSTRKYFGEEEDVYIMDAKTRGNIGRYLNHSCSPNVFVQNCFVDTHDLRFPWVAFFALEYIRAGSELCWDYCYVVGQVDGKEILCSCGTNQCRGRLL